MKIGIMGGSYNGDGEITTKVYEIAKTLSKYNNFVMGPNETGLLKKVKDVLFENNKNITIYGLDTGDFKEVRGTTKYKVKTVTDRIANLYKESDIIIFLPGGVGTRAEFYTMLDSKMELKCDKKIYLYNEFGDFDLLLQELKTLKEKNYINKDEDLSCYFKIISSCEEIKKLL